MYILFDDNLPFGRPIVYRGYNVHDQAISYLHDEALQRNPVIVVGVLHVELEIVVEDETALHVLGHLETDGGSSCGSHLILTLLVSLESLETCLLDYRTQSEFAV